MKKDGYGKGNWGSVKMVYKKKGEDLPEENALEEENKFDQKPMDVEEEDT